MIITGDGGLPGNDYLLLKQGAIESYVYTPSSGHVRYKEVRRSESGTAVSGQQVKIPAYFKSQPTIHLYPRDISIYNASYPAQSQRLEITHTPPEPHPTEEGAWVFTPYARLVLSEGSDTVSGNWTYSGNSNQQDAVLTGITNLQAVTVYGRAASRRHSGSGNNYQNRQVTMQLFYKVTGTSAWIHAGGDSSVPVNGFNTHSLSVSKSLSANTYDILVRFIAADRSGTFVSGEVTYDYTDSTKTGNLTTYALTPEYGSSAAKQSHSLSLNSPALGGWEIYRIDYEMTFDLTLRACERQYGWYANPSQFTGYARVRIPENGSTREYYLSGAGSGIGWNEQTHSNITTFWSDTSFKDGTVRGNLELEATTKKTFDPQFGNDIIYDTGYASVSVKQLTGRVYYRKVQAASAAPFNQFYFDSASYNRGAVDISLSNAVVTWNASGE